MRRMTGSERGDGRGEGGWVAKRRVGDGGGVDRGEEEEEEEEDGVLAGDILVVGGFGVLSSTQNKTEILIHLSN